MTANVMSDDKELSLKSAMIRFITKPIDIKSIVAKITRYILVDNQ